MTAPRRTSKNKGTSVSKEPVEVRRLRCLGYVIQPQFMIDDGENLTPLKVDPVAIPAANWQDVLVIVEQATAQLREQVEGPHPA